MCRANSRHHYLHFCFLLRFQINHCYSSCVLGIMGKIISFVNKPPRDWADISRLVDICRRVPGFYNHFYQLDRFLSVFICMAGLGWAVVEPGLGTGDWGLVKQSNSQSDPGQEQICCLAPAVCRVSLFSGVIELSLLIKLAGAESLTPPAGRD